MEIKEIVALIAIGCLSVIFIVLVGISAHRDIQRYKEEKE